MYRERGDLMVKKFKLVIIDSKYCDYLREFDDRVPYNFSKKENRPFVGILFEIENIKYFAPLSSPKEKHRMMHNMLDFLKIDDGKLGVLNFNNMIPVPDCSYYLINMNDPNKLNDIKYYNLLLDQLSWLNEHYIQVKNKSKRLYKLYTLRKLSKVIFDRCCDFTLLEEKCRKYNKEMILA